MTTHFGHAMRYVAAGAVTGRYTHTQNNYRNPTVYAPRVNTTL